MAKYILGIPGVTGNSEIIDNYDTTLSGLEGLLVSVDTNGKLIVADGTKPIFGVAQENQVTRRISVSKGREVPVKADAGISSSVAGKEVYVTAQGTVTDDTSAAPTLFVFSAVQEGGVTDSRGNEVSPYALINTI
jgi:hypothetical protein